MDNNEILYWLETYANDLYDRIQDEEPIFQDKDAESSYKFGLICAYDMLKSRLEDVTDIEFENVIKPVEGQR